MEEKKEITVLSLCDGMSCGQITLAEEGIKVNKYFASEIKDIGIQVTKDNYPGTIHIGDLTKISYENGVLHTEVSDFETEIDMVMFGSPCQTFSVACKTDKRIGLEDDMKSGLFLQCYRILKEINPKFFFMENVASMKDDDKNFITELMGVDPIKINADKVSPALRNRYYWTNLIPSEDIKTIDIKLNDILEDGWSDRDKAHSLLVSDCRPGTTPVKMFHRYYFKGFINIVFKSKEHYKKCVEYYNNHYRGMKAKEIPIDETDIFDGIRNFTQLETERCQCVPEGYTRCLCRNDACDVLGDGWNIEVIRHFFKELHTYGY